MPENVIGDLCFKLLLRGRYEQQVTDFARAQGEEACISVLKKIQTTREHQKKQGIRVDGAVGLWKKHSEQYVKSLSGRKRRESEENERVEQKKAHEESKSRGYEPTREAIKAQLDDLYEDSKISIHEYNWGIKGLGCVRELVEQAQELPEEEAGAPYGRDLPFDADLAQEAVNPFASDDVEIDPDLAAMMGRSDKF